MYDELVKRIRSCSYSDPNGCDECRDCPNADNFYECKQKLALQAADAIEELQKVANKLLVKYQEEATNVIWEYSGNIEKDIDRLNEEVRTLMAQINGMPLPDPPKEE